MFFRLQNFCRLPLQKENSWTRELICIGHRPIFDVVQQRNGKLILNWQQNTSVGLFFIFFSACYLLACLRAVLRAGSRARDDYYTSVTPKASQQNGDMGSASKQRTQLDLLCNPLSAIRLSRLFASAPGCPSGYDCAIDSFRSDGRLVAWQTRSVDAMRADLHAWRRKWQQQTRQWRRTADTIHHDKVLLVPLPPVQLTTRVDHVTDAPV